MHSIRKCQHQEADVKTMRGNGMWLVVAAFFEEIIST